MYSKELVLESIRWSWCYPGAGISRFGICWHDTAMGEFVTEVSDCMSECKSEQAMDGWMDGWMDG